jgi:VanZ family protein
MLLTEFSATWEVCAWAIISSFYDYARMVYKFRRKKFAVAVCLILMYGAAGFYPFRWSFPFIAYENAAQRNRGGAWQFPKAGIAKTRTVPEWLSKAIQLSSLDIVLEIRSLNSNQSGPARILSISEDPYRRNLTIAQEGTNLVLRLRTPKTSLNGMPSYQIDDVFARPEWQRIEVLIRPGEIQVQVNGRRRVFDKVPAHALLVWANDYSLALGNEMTFDRPWLGEVRRAEIKIGDEVVDYARADLLSVTAQYSVPRSTCLVQVIPFSCSQLDQYRLLDWLLNLIGFVPFGLLIAGLFRGKGTIRYATLASFALSLSMEVGQIYLPGRFPSSEDLLLNTIGGALGASFAAKIYRVTQ